MSRKCSCLLGIFAFLAAISCQDKVDDSNLATFTGETVTDYIRSQDDLSSFAYVLSRVHLSSRSKSTLDQLLSTRGNYTTFAPTNEAIRIYLDSIYGQGFDLQNIPDSTAEYLAKNTLIDNADSKAYFSTDFTGVSGGVLDKMNMNDRFIKIEFDSVTSAVLVNSKSVIVLKDVEVENGVVHKINRVVSPSTASLPSLLAQGENTRVFSYLLDVTGWGDKMQKYRMGSFQGYDSYEEYVLEHPDAAAGGTMSGNKKNPPHRNYGYTAFVETDNVLQLAMGFVLDEAANGTIQNWDKVMEVVATKCKEYYPEATAVDLRSEDNAVNQFVSYHLIAAAIPYNKLVIHYNERGMAYDKPENLGINVWEYYETMGKYRRLVKLIEGQTTNGIRINRYSTYNDGHTGDYRELTVERPGIKVLSSNNMTDNSALNGFYYPIDDVLVYDDEVPNKVLNERMRYDVTSLLPEMISNGLRRTSDNSEWHFPAGYFDNLTVTSETNPFYLAAYSQGWCNYQGDEFNIVGQYDVTLRLPPVPYDGTYELRMGMSINPRRGMAQVYLGENKANLLAVGVPVDLRVETTAPEIGWVIDNEDDEFNVQLDKTLRNHGYMKAPNSYNVGSKTPVSTGVRNTSYSAYGRVSRKILWNGQMQKNKTYYLRLKSVLTSTQTELWLDYIEIVPRSVFNGTKSEDWW